MKNSSWWLLLTGLIWTIAILLNGELPSWANVLIFLSTGITGAVACVLTENQNYKIKNLEKRVEKPKKHNDKTDEHLFFSQRLYLEKEYYKWKIELDKRSGCVTLDCPMLMVSFLQDRGYLNINKVTEDWRLMVKEILKKEKENEQ